MKVKYINSRIVLCQIISHLGIDQGALLVRVVGVGAYNHCMSASGDEIQVKYK